MSKSERLRAFEKEACEIFGVDSHNVLSMEISLDARELPKAIITLLALKEHGDMKWDEITHMPMTETREVILHEPPRITGLEAINAVP